MLSGLVSGYGENFVSAGVFFIGIDILRGVKMWESEGFVNVGRFVKVSDWLTCISPRTKRTVAFCRRGLGREGIGTIMMMQY